MIQLAITSADVRYAAQALLAALAVDLTAGQQKSSWGSAAGTDVVRQEYDQYAGACSACSQPDSNLGSDITGMT